MVTEILLSSLGALRQGDAEKRLKRGGSGDCIRSRRHENNGGDVGRRESRYF